MRWQYFLAAMLGIAVVGCGDGTASTPATTSATTTSTTIATAPTTAAPPTAATATASSSATAEINDAFVVFFNGKDRDLDKKVSLLENGERYRQMLIDAFANPQFQQMSTTIRSVTVLPAAECAARQMTSPCALVVHDLLVGGFPALAGHESPALQIGGKWKIGSQAWCDLVRIGGATCPA